MKACDDCFLNCKKASDKEKGFTLIEVIVVIAVLGILSGILVVNIVSYINKSKAERIVYDCGIIIRAIDAYEAENNDNSSAYVYSDFTNCPKDEYTVCLDDIYHEDAANNHIFGTGVIKDLGPYFKLNADDSSDKILHIPISHIRAIAKRDITVTANSNGTIKSYKGKAYQNDGNMYAVDKTVSSGDYKN